MKVDYTKHATIQVEAGNCLWKFSEISKPSTEGKIFVKTLTGFDKNTRFPVISFSEGDFVEIHTGKRKRNIGLVDRIVFEKQALCRTRPTATDITLTVDWLYSIQEMRKVVGAKVAEFNDPTEDSFYLSDHHQSAIPLSAVECKINEEALDLAGILRLPRVKKR